MRGGRRPAVAAALVLAVLVGGCSDGIPGTTLNVNGWTVTCVTADHSVCRDVATAGIQFVFQARPTGVVSVTDRPECPTQTSTSDGSHCWQVAIPVGSRIACIVLARQRFAPGEYELLAADAPGRTTIGDPVACT